MSEYLGTFGLQPLYDGHQSFYGKALVERWSGPQYVLKSYGTVVAKVTTTYEDNDAETFDVELDMRSLSATTLRHVKEFLAQTDVVFKGVTLAWLRKAIKDGRPVAGLESYRSRTYTLKAM